MAKWIILVSVVYLSLGCSNMSKLPSLFGLGGQSEKKANPSLKFKFKYGARVMDSQSLGVTHFHGLGVGNNAVNFIYKNKLFLSAGVRNNINYVKMLTEALSFAVDYAKSQGREIFMLALPEKNLRGNPKDSSGGGHTNSMDLSKLLVLDYDQLFSKNPLAFPGRVFFVDDEKVSFVRERYTIGMKVNGKIVLNILLDSEKLAKQAQESLNKTVDQYPKLREKNFVMYFDLNYLSLEELPQIIGYAQPL